MRHFTLHYFRSLIFLTNNIELGNFSLLMKNSKQLMVSEFLNDNTIVQMRLEVSKLNSKEESSSISR